ncbi:MAG: septum formation initiator family protein [Mailhella sp.]|nr:septum formation initiator family protein [Mailhella sp.]
MSQKSSNRTAAIGKMFFLVLVLMLNVALLSRLIWGSQSVYSWQALKEKQAELSEELNALDERRAALSREIRLLKTDPAYVEKVIRQRLNYVRKNEILYLFDKNRTDGSAWNETEDRK